MCSGERRAGAVTGEQVGKGLSLLLALGYGIVVATRAGGSAGLIVLLLALVPVAIIWWADGIGSYTGSCGDGSIDAASPGCLIRAIGWAMLLLPLGIMVWRTMSR
jgi:hypothetical protein